jgi:O-antigen/teichoic acid export membrane protein
MSNEHSFLKNTISNYSIIFTKLGIAFFTIPIYVSVYGEDLYGIFILSTSLVTSLTFLDFGAGKSLVRYSAEYRIDRDEKKFNQALNFATTLNLLSVIIITVISVIILLNINSIFSIPQEKEFEAKILFGIAIISAIFLFLDFIPSNILQGSNIFHQKNKYLSIVIILHILIIISVYFFKPNIIIFGLMNSALIIITYLIDVYIVKKNKIITGFERKIRFSKELFDHESFKYSKEIFLMSLVGFFSTQADVFIIGSLMSVKYVTIYTILTRPYFILKTLSSNIFTALQPHIIKIKSSKESLSVFIENITECVLSGYIFALLTFIVLGRELFELWLGTSSYNQYFAWAILAVLNWVLSGFYGLVFRVMFTTGETFKLLKVDSIAALLNGVISIIITYIYGFQGVIIGTTVQMILLSYFVFKEGIKLYDLKLSNILTKVFVKFGIEQVTLILLWFTLMEYSPQYKWSIYLVYTILASLSFSVIMLKKLKELNLNKLVKI